MNWIRRVAWIWVALVLAAGLFGPAPARALDLPGTPLSVCVARVQAGDSPAGMLRAATGRYRCSGSRTHFGRGDFWVRSSPLPAHSGEANPIDLRFASVWQDGVTTFALYADGRAAVTHLDARGLSRHLRLGAIVSVRIPNRDVAVTRILWRVDGAAGLRGVVMTPTIASPADSATADLMLCAIYAAFTGLCVALLIYNIALWAAMRHRFQLIYCIMVLGLLAYASSISGFLAWIIPNLDNNDRLRINYLTLAIAASSALLFARTFFEERVFAGWLSRASDVIVTVQIGAALAFAILAPWRIGLLDRLYALSFIPLLLMVVPMLWRAWRLRSNYLWLFAIAWGTPVAMGIVRVASALHLIGWNLWVDQSTILSMTLEALLSSLAIAYRIRLLSLERDEAREQEIAARLLADTDPLTGLLNRRAFLAQAIGRAGDQTLLILDIDHFKRVNETIGHDGGDEVLRVVARALRAAMPQNALVARVGGEEFATIADADAAISPGAILDRLRAERMPFDVTVTSSIGTCTGPLLREVDWKALYRQADRALFAAKAAGRDRARDATQLAVAA